MMQPGRVIEDPIESSCDSETDPLIINDNSSSIIRQSLLVSNT